jgi:excisionase family DNA binding protein
MIITMLLTQQPTFEQMPSFLAGIAGEVLTIKETLLNTSLHVEAEKPTDVPGAADHTNLDEQTIYRLVRQKEIPFHKRGKKLYFYKSELNQWIKSGKGKTLEELQNEAEGETLSLNKNKRA